MALLEGTGWLGALVLLCCGLWWAAAGAGLIGWVGSALSARADG